jgi:hypothetical protein
MANPPPGLFEAMFYSLMDLIACVFKFQRNNTSFPILKQILCHFAPSSHTLWIRAKGGDKDIGARAL